MFDRGGGETTVVAGTVGHGDFVWKGKMCLSGECIWWVVDFV